MATLKKALLKAGVVTEKQIQQAEVRDHQQKVQQFRKEKEIKKQGVLDRQKEEKKHIHHLRTLCDACNKTSPDVEFYRHNNQLLGKYWLCINCADNNSIHDKCRETAQSSNAKTGMFIRRWGPTLNVSGKKDAPAH